jgi:hypothetical protein
VLADLAGSLRRIAKHLAPAHGMAHQKQGDRAWNECLGEGGDVVEDLRRRSSVAARGAFCNGLSPSSTNVSNVSKTELGVCYLWSKLYTSMPSEVKVVKKLSYVLTVTCQTFRPRSPRSNTHYATMDVRITSKQTSVGENSHLRSHV